MIITIRNGSSEGLKTVTGHLKLNLGFRPVNSPKAQRGGTRTDLNKEAQHA